ncbi:uncharacterized protein LOC128712741 [Anopheles marshallii]|uniref:uncharacterized protein LOC128712741 n=1 Tax=Anopheles marshallii TaxID=1521116 RepID=UPI00237B64B7|nr:uncharacterized protein LOC128712741 [Anopheles marshallii]
MGLNRTLLTFSLVTVLWFNAGCGLPTKSATDDTDTATNAEDDYNPQCLPLDYFEKGQSEETRVKRDGDAVLADATSTNNEADEVVAQPGFVVPARRRRPCLGRRRNFTKDCGPLARAYKVKNFVMAPPPPMRRKIKPGKPGI